MVNVSPCSVIVTSSNALYCTHSGSSNVFFASIFSWTICPQTEATFLSRIVTSIGYAFSKDWLVTVICMVPCSSTEADSVRFGIWNSSSTPIISVSIQESTSIFSWCSRYMRNTCQVGVFTIFSPSVKMTACNTFTVCARFAIFTRSECLLKIFRLIPAINASRMIFCWYKNPGLVPGSTLYQLPHSSTIMPICLSGSYWSMIALWRRINVSI